LSLLWSQMSGPGTVAFGDDSAVDTSASFNQAGTYILRLTANDTLLTRFDEVTITVQGGDPIPPPRSGDFINRITRSQPFHAPCTDGLIEIFNQSGDKVKTLRCTNGMSEIWRTAGEMAAGVYFYIHGEVKKFVVVK